MCNDVSSGDSRPHARLLRSRELLRVLYDALLTMKDSLVPLVHAYGLWPEQVSSQDIGEVINSLAGNQLSSKARLVSSDESMGMRAVPPHGTRASDLDDSIFGGFGRL